MGSALYRCATNFVGNHEFHLPHGHVACVALVGHPVDGLGMVEGGTGSGGPALHRPWLDRQGTVVHHGGKRGQVISRLLFASQAGDNKLLVALTGAGSRRPILTMTVQHSVSVLVVTV